MKSERIEQVGRLARSHAAPLLLYARQWSNQPDDIVQDALIDLLGVEPWPTSPVAWLYGAVRFRSLNGHRAARRRIKHETRLAIERRPWFEVEPTNRLQADEAMGLLQSLSQELREVVILRLWSSLTFEQIGQLLAVDASTACRRFSTAIEQLKQKCDALPPVSSESPLRTS